MNNKAFRFGPIALTNTLTTNILNPATATGGVNAGSSSQYILLKKVRVVNKTATPATVSFWLGATGANAAGTEVLWQGFTVPANSFVESTDLLRLDAADFLVGGCSLATTCSIYGEGEIGVAG
jgi:hypothetical protein